MLAANHQILPTTSPYPAIGGSSVSLHPRVTRSAVTYRLLQGLPPPTRTPTKSRTNRYEFRGTLKATTSKLCAGYGEGRLHTNPGSHYTPVRRYDPGCHAWRVFTSYRSTDSLLPLHLLPSCTADRRRKTWLAVNTASLASHCNVDRA